MTRREWISSLPLGLALFEQGRGSATDQGAETARIVVAAEKGFGLRLLREMVDRRQRENVFISPLSIFLALHMAENGAAGATQSAMRKTLELPDLDAATLNASAAALAAGLKSGNPDALRIANALWADRQYPLAPDYLKLCAATFGARAESLDFHDPRAAAEINEWVKQATGGKIANLVTADAIAKAVVVLTNAVYFAAAWRTAFPPAQTQTAAFHLADGRNKSVPMMHQVRIAEAYREGANFQGAMLYYKQSSIFLYALLPNAGKTARDVLESLDAEHLTAGQSGFDLDLKLPRFTMDFSASLGAYLEQMGMGLAFRYPGADFGPMGSRQFFISEVIHKTRLEVDEKGTVAAAATAVTMTAAAMRQPREVKTLVFDRPFVVLLGDAQSGALVFAGAIENP